MMITSLVGREVAEHVEAGSLVVFDVVVESSSFLVGKVYQVVGSEAGVVSVVGLWGILLSELLGFVV